jgi:hypothetical protein
MSPIRIFYLNILLHDMFERIYFPVHSILKFSVHIRVPSLVASEMSELLLEQFSHVEISVHPGGHFVPAAGPEKQNYIRFLEDRKHEMDTEDRRRAKQIQVGSYTLERVDDCSSEPSEDDGIVSPQGEDCVDSTCGEKCRMKANKGGISKQTRKKMMQSRACEDLEVSNSKYHSRAETRST